MFRHLAHQASQATRRYASTHAGPSVRYTGFRNYALGASVAAASFMLWSLHSTGSALHLDNQPTAAKTSKPAQRKATPQDSDASLQSEAASEQKGSDAPSGNGSTASSEETPEGSESGASGGAFNPETGEINWDCPCLGGMAHGPCGQQFRDAFSCFVYSEDEPKGINCVDKFKAMQDCFREHPEVYGEEIMDDDDDVPQASATEGATLVEGKVEEAKLESLDTEPTPKQTSRRSTTKSSPSPSS